MILDPRAMVVYDGRVRDGSWDVRRTHEQVPVPTNLRMLRLLLQSAHRHQTTPPKTTGETVPHG